MKRFLFSAQPRSFLLACSQHRLRGVCAGRSSGSGDRSGPSSSGSRADIVICLCYSVAEIGLLATYVAQREESVKE